MFIKSKLFMVKLMDAKKENSYFSCMVCCQSYLEAVNSAKKILQDKNLFSPDVKSVDNLGDCWYKGEKE
jgi:hypothetical protein